MRASGIVEQTGLKMLLEDYSGEELRKLVNLAQSLQSMASLEHQQRFAADLHQWLTTELGRRHQVAAKAAG